MTITTTATLVGTAQSFVISTGESQLRGPPGPGANTFIWTQSIALSVWTVPHNLGRYPSVTVVNTNGQKVEPDVSYIDNNTVRITFGAPFVGSAYLN